MRLKTLAVAVSLLSLAVTSVALDAQGAADAPAAATYDAYGLRLFHELAADPRMQGKNVFVSPLSAGVAFSLALSGANGFTRAELARTLGVAPEGEAALHRANAELAAALTSPDVTLIMANSLWGRRDAPFLAGFTAGARRWYRAQVTPVDFADAATANRINAWAARTTHDRIRAVVRAPMDTTLVLMLLNAVYFKGRWAAAFAPGNTRPAPFHRAAGSTVRVPMMHRSMSALLACGDGYRVARLPYQGGRFAMYILLPASGRSARALISALSPATWRRDGGWRERALDVSLPRFTVRGDLDLAGPMKRMGAPTAFDRNLADFTRMVPRAWLQSIRRNASLGSARQSTFLQVDEEGTEAAAVTGLGFVVPTAVVQREPFVVDRPFVLAIRDDRTGTLLFIGLIEDPTGEGSG